MYQDAMGFILTYSISLVASMIIVLLSYKLNEIGFLDDLIMKFIEFFFWVHALTWVFIGFLR